jgi:hypothetical protein
MKVGLLLLSAVLILPSCIRAQENWMPCAFGNCLTGPQLDQYVARLFKKYSPCAKATQPFQIDDVRLTSPGQIPPEQSRQFKLMFSQAGVDVYAVRIGKQWTSVLIIFQDEKSRRAFIRLLVSAVALSWNQEPTINLKYVTLEFSWVTQHTEPEPFILNATFYAPIACYSRKLYQETLASSVIGGYVNASPQYILDPNEVVLYKAAVEFNRMRRQKE